MTSTRTLALSTVKLLRNEGMQLPSPPPKIIFLASDVIFKLCTTYLCNCDVIDLVIAVNCGVICNWVSAKWPLSNETQLTHIH